jgi:hypothetical protein
LTLLERVKAAADAIEEWRGDDDRATCIEEACEAEEVLREVAKYLEATNG